MRRGVRKDYLKGSRRNGRGYAPYPFDRFLESRLGRLWDEVYSEICQEFDSRSLAGYSFLRDLKWHVATDCWIGAETGTVYSSRWGGSSVENEFYVHPFTGVLCWAEKIDRSHPEPPVAKLPIEEGHAYEKIDGIWYETWYDGPFEMPWNFIGGWHSWELHHKWLIRKKVQLGKKKLQELKVRNGQGCLYDRCKRCGADYRCVHRIIDRV